MSDDISIPSPTYRVPRHAGGMDPATRKLAMIAAGIGGALLVVVGGWTMVSHRSHGVPVIQADGSPLRVKPANPGGMQVAGAGNDIFSGGSDTAVGKLAPPAETPDPQGLRAAPPPEPAALAQAAPPVAVVKPVPDAPAVIAPRMPVATQAGKSAASVAGVRTPGPAAVPAGAEPRLAGVEPRPSGTDSRTVVPAVAQSQSPGKSAAANATEHAAEHGAGRKPALVQLAALSSEQAARAEWDKMAKRWPDLFGGHQPAFSKVEHGSQVFWRVRTGGFDGVAQASTFCERLRAKGGGCSVADF